MMYMVGQQPERVVEVEKEKEVSPFAFFAAVFGLLWAMDKILLPYAYKKGWIARL